MMEELDMHLIDLFQNAVSSGATTIKTSIRCDEDVNQLTMRVADNGRGMDEKTLEAVRYGYFSSKSPRSVGLGIPLLRETAEHCDGRFLIESAVGVGTTVTATFRRDHIDLPPFGDLASTFLNLLVTSDGRRVTITFRCGKNDLEIDTAMLADLLGGVSLQHPDVIRFLQGYIAEHIGEE